MGNGPRDANRTDSRRFAKHTANGRHKTRRVRAVATGRGKKPAECVPKMGRVRERAGTSAQAAKARLLSASRPHGRPSDRKTSTFPIEMHSAMFLPQPPHDSRTRPDSRPTPSESDHSAGQVVVPGRPHFPEPAAPTRRRAARITLPDGSLPRRTLRTDRSGRRTACPADPWAAAAGRLRPARRRPPGRWGRPRRARP